MTESLKQRLRDALNARSGVNSKKMSKLEEDELFKQEYLDMKGKNLPRADRSFKVIPQFYKSLPTEDDVLQQKLREEARAQFLQRRSKLLLDNAELKELWAVLDSHTSGPPLAEEQMMDWDQFCVVRSLVSDKCREYFRYKIVYFPTHFFGHPSKSNGFTSGLGCLLSSSRATGWAESASWLCSTTS